MSLKPSTQSIQRYPGNLGEEELKNAINLLFLIKGKVIQKKSPEFCIPTAEEFFFFSKTASEELFNKMNPKKMHRALSSERIERTHTILQFLESALHIRTESIQDRISLCVYVVLYALFVYIYTNILYKTNDIRILTKDANIVNIYKHLFFQPLRAFCIHYMPCLEKSKTDIRNVCVGFFQTTISPNLTQFDKDTFYPNQPILKIAQGFSNIFDSIVIPEEAFEKVFKDQVVAILS